MKNRAMITVAIFLSMAPLPAGAVDVGPVAVHGFISQGFIDSTSYSFLADSKGGSFRFNEFGVNFSSDLQKDLRVGLQLVSRGLGQMEENKVKLDWASADYHWQDWLGIRVGKIKIPVGFYTDVMDLDTARSQIIPPTSVYNLYLRDMLIAVTGGGLYGNVKLGSAGDFDYTLFTGNITLDTDASLATILREKAGVALSRTNSDLASGINLKWNSLFGLRLNASYLQTNNIDLEGSLTALSLPYKNRKDVTVQSFGAEYSWKNITLLGEVMTIPQDDYTTVNLPTGPLVSSSRMVTGGAYGQFSYRVNNWFEASSYYSVLYRDTRDKDGKKALAAGTATRDFEAWQKDFALTGRFDVSDNWIIKLEGHAMDGTAFAIGPPTDRYWYLWAAKATFTF